MDIVMKYGDPIGKSRHLTADDDERTDALIKTLLARIEELERALEHISAIASRGDQTSGEASRDLSYIADYAYTARAALAKPQK